MLIGQGGIFKSDVKVGPGNVMGTCKLMTNAIKDLDLGIFRSAAYEPA